MIKPLLLSRSDSKGGAARAAYRLHRALLASSVDSTMWVDHKSSDDWRVHANQSKVGRALALVRPTLDGLPTLLQRSEMHTHRSPGLLSSLTAQQINSASADIAHMHWICGGYISIKQIGKIRKPIVWTLHDMWAFCGAEHLADAGDEARWKNGYSTNNRLTNDGGLDVDAWIWRRKQRYWKKSISLVTPSNWLADCAKKSALFSGWPVSVIPNALDTSVFKPLNKQFCRAALNLPQDVPIVTFGALAGSKDANKGFDLLLDALHHYINIHDAPQAHCVILGQNEPQCPPSIPMPNSWLGHVADDATLALLYGASDVVVVPSRIENFPQMATEAHACGIPVVAFAAGGLGDVVAAYSSGYLAKAYLPEDLAQGIAWVLGDSNRWNSLSEQARMRAEKYWSFDVVSKQYIKLYSNVVSSLFI